MSIFLKDEWQEWARDWSLSHYPQRGWLQRTERVIGEHKGFLIRVGWGASRSPQLIVVIRFPRTEDAKRLRQALVDDSKLDELPAKGSARRKMKIVDDEAKALSVGPRPGFLLTETALLWCRAFPWSAPKTSQVQSWVEALVDALERATPHFEGRCEACETGTARRYVLVDGLPTLMCFSCQVELRVQGEAAERAYDAIDVRYVPGFMLGVVAAAIGAVAWAAIGVTTQRMFSAAAIGIGAMVAWAYRTGAARVDGAGRVLAAGLTLASVVLGEILLYAWWVSKAQPNAGFDLDAGWFVYAKAWAEHPKDEALTLVFGLVGAWFATRALQRPRLRASLETADDQERLDKAA